MNTVKAMRKKANLTQKALAEKMGANVRWVQKLESGEISLQNITFMNAVRLIQALAPAYYDPDLTGENSAEGIMRSAYIIMRSLLKQKES